MQTVVLRFRGIFCFPDILCIFVLSFKEVHEAAVERQHYSWAPGWNESPHPSCRAGRVVCSTKSKEKPTHKNTLKKADNWGKSLQQPGEGRGTKVSGQALPCFLLSDSLVVQSMLGGGSSEHLGKTDKDSKEIKAFETYKVGVEYPHLSGTCPQSLK